MESIAEILEQELEDAFEVKNKKSLHRYVLLLTENVVKKENYERQQLEIRSDIRDLTEIVRLGFQRVDERFEAMQLQMDKRFEQVDKRFEQVDKRFEEVDKRFEEVYKHFEQVDKHFETVENRIENLFARMFQFMIWSFGLSISLAGIIIGVIKFL